MKNRKATIRDEGGASAHPTHHNLSRPYIMAAMLM